MRPHFFRGVATVVSKLFNIIQPTRAYFGQKDVQQCSVVRSLVRDLHFPLDIVVANTIRESDGLAMSSRNRFLSPSERALAPILYKAMQAATHAFKCGVVSRKELITVMDDVLSTAGCTSQYWSIAEPFSLQELESISPDSGAILSGAIVVGKTRIIDNVLLGVQRDDI